ncbi:MAG TPA: chromosome partitioning protein ParB, partial [Solirubrobacterales bacterium]|nr:chromosome partitioning protein ParB [Solirubrobacterales bacterium]
RLLDLPDETLDLLESGELSEGHGRALLAASGNDVRRRLARDAVRGGWSVRETENRVRLASQPKRSKVRREAVGAEEAAALRDTADRLESVFGHEVKVRPRGGEVAVEIRLADLDEARALVRKLTRKGA